MKQFNELYQSVTRIFCKDKAGNESSGTGFITAIHENGETHNPILVTNKHVIAGQTEIRICMNVRDEAGNILPSNNLYVSLPIESKWYFHPDPDIDLCAFQIGGALLHQRSQGNDVVWRSIPPTLIPDLETLGGLDVVEDIIMLGYPIGIWDEYNNRPLFRKGITATHPALSFNEGRHFMVDIAAFPGSSGSPIFAYKEGFEVVNSAGKKIINKNGKFYLIGVLYAGPMFDAKGSIHVKTIPTTQGYEVHSKIPTNLGYAIPAHIIKDFETIIPLIKAASTEV
jgi:hypothetical protein